MYLGEFLGYFDFDYYIVNGQIRLIDNQGAYLGDIDRDRFGLDAEGISALVDRLDVYIKESVFDDLTEVLEDNGLEFGELSLAELVKMAHDNKVNYAFGLTDVILEPEKLEVDREKIIESFSVGQAFYEIDTGRVIELDCLNEAGDWRYRVFDSENNYLYDSYISPDELARCVGSGFATSITHNMKLRIEPDTDVRCNSKGVVSASLELNDKLVDRFAVEILSNSADFYGASVKYDIETGKCDIELGFVSYGNDPEIVDKKVVVVSATNEEMDSLVKEMKSMAPELFEIERERYGGVLERTLSDIKEDPFFRIDNFKNEPWYGELQCFVGIGVCRPQPEHMSDIQKALKLLGYSTETKMRPNTGEVYLVETMASAIDNGKLCEKTSLDETIKNCEKDKNTVVFGGAGKEHVLKEELGL